MIDFALPWLLALLPLPLLVRRLLPPAPEGRDGALRVPFYRDLASLPAGGDGTGPRERAALVLQVLAWALLVVGAAQPRWVGEPRPVATHGRDLMLALDLSGSMATEDFAVGGQAVDRLGVVGAVARRFVSDRVGDRIGLVLFGSRAYLQAPLTFDRETVAGFLDEAEIGLAGEETAIGDAIGLGVKHLRVRPADESVLILLSVGASNAGVLEPIRAAEIAAREGVRIHTIGIGSGVQSLPTPFGGSLPVPTQLDEATLQRVAELTGGRYFRARDTAGLVDVYRRIDALEPTEGDAAPVRPTRALFHWPLGAALGLASLLLLWRLAGESGLGAGRTPTAATAPNANDMGTLS